MDLDMALVVDGKRSMVSHVVTVGGKIQQEEPNLSMWEVVKGEVI